MSRDLLKLISEKFTSGNSVEVERITITRAEYEEHLAKPEPRNDAAWHWHDLYKAKCQEFHDKQTMLGTEIVALEEEIAELKEDQTEPHIVKVSMPDTQCGHCGGSGCVLCDAKFLPKPEQEPKLTDAGADTNISRGLEPKGSGMVTLHQPEQADRKTLIECIAGSISMHMTIGLYPKELLAAAEYIVDNYTAPPRKPWVGLTDYDLNPLVEKCAKYYGYEMQPVQTAGFYWLADALSAKLKELNG